MNKHLKLDIGDVLSDEKTIQVTKEISVNIISFIYVMFSLHGYQI